MKIGKNESKILEGFFRQEPICDLDLDGTVYHCQAINEYGDNRLNIRFTSPKGVTVEIDVWLNFDFGPQNGYVLLEKDFNISVQLPSEGYIFMDPDTTKITVPTLRELVENALADILAFAKHPSPARMSRPDYSPINARNNARDALDAKL
jgi:hypothetical protein